MAVEFPEKLHLDFLKAADPLFHPLLSDENHRDPLHRRTHFTSAWLAVKYRYRTCSECNVDFKQLFLTVDDDTSLIEQRESHYKLDKCIYSFFVSGLSVFDSLGYCLYFLGAVLKPDDFPLIHKPRNINLDATTKAFEKAFPKEALSNQLRTLLLNDDFKSIWEFRNILAHRITGNRSTRSWGHTAADGTYTHEVEDNWHIPGAKDDPDWSELMIEQHLIKIVSRISAIEFPAVELTTRWAALAGA